MVQIKRKGGEIMAGKSIEEQLESIQKKQAQLKARERQLKAKQSKAEREKRTHRLCTVAGIVEKYCGEITDYEAFERYVSQYANAIKATQKQNEM